jgi:hypothetical protein
MARKKVYIVKSGSLHKTTQQFWLTPTYFSSKKVALLEAKQVLDINRAKEILEHDEYIKHDPNVISMTDYVGEEGKYKARVIVEWAWLNQY